MLLIRSIDMESPWPRCGYYITDLVPPLISFKYAFAVLGWLSLRENTDQKNKGYVSRSVCLAKLNNFEEKMKHTHCIKYTEANK